MKSHLTVEIQGHDSQAQIATYVLLGCLPYSRWICAEHGAYLFCLSDSIPTPLTPRSPLKWSIDWTPILYSQTARQPDSQTV